MHLRRIAAPPSSCMSGWREGVVLVYHHNLFIRKRVDRLQSPGILIGCGAFSYHC